jgi:hypothetical protein
MMFEVNMLAASGMNFLIQMGGWAVVGGGISESEISCENCTSVY